MSNRRLFRRFAAEFCLVVAALISLSVLIRTLDLDLRVSGWFFRPGAIPDWWGKDRQPWDALYRFGTWPALLAGAVAVLGLIISVFRPVLRRYRRSYIYLILVLAIGPGLLVNMVLKDHWGRPRPRHVVELGGTDQFLPVGEPGVPGKGKGFASGHAAMGFYFTSLYILWRYRRPRAARAALSGGLAGGVLIGFQRIASGGHFLSDVVWAGGIVYLAGLVADAALPREGDEADVRRSLTPVLLGLAGAGALAIAVFGTPYYREFEERFGPLRAGTEVRVAWRASGMLGSAGGESIRQDGSTLTVQGVIRGYGYFDNEVTSVFDARHRGDTLEVCVWIVPRGLFTRLTPDVTYRIDAHQSGGGSTRAPLRPPNP